MNVTATNKYIRISPKKVRTVAPNLVNMNVVQALEALRFADKKASFELSKALKTALSDATHNFRLDAAALTVKTIEIGPGPSYKRFIARSRGMGHPILKRSSHIKITLTDEPQVKSEKSKVAKKVVEVVEAKPVEQTEVATEAKAVKATRTKKGSK